jgi:hypothetical protein
MELTTEQRIDYQLSECFRKAPVKFLFGAERLIREVVPNAQLVISYDKKHQPTHIGVYDISICLNDRHNFKASEQFSPQLIGSRSLYPSYLSESGKQQQAMEAWVSAYKHLSALGYFK